MKSSSAIVNGSNESIDVPVDRSHSSGVRSSRPILDIAEPAHLARCENATVFAVGSKLRTTGEKNTALETIFNQFETAVYQLIDTKNSTQQFADRHLLRVAKRIHRINSRCQTSLGTQFQNPPLNILLELYISSEQEVKSPVKNVCLVACASQSTALRWVQRLVDLGLVMRRQDDEDARRTLLELSPKGRRALSSLLSAA